MLIDELLDNILLVCADVSNEASEQINELVKAFRVDSPVAEVRTALRLTTHALDAEIALIIDAAREDLHRIGVQGLAFRGPLARMAILTYARAQQSDEPAKRIALMDSYNAISDALRKAGTT